MKGWKLVPLEMTEAQNVAAIFTASQFPDVLSAAELDEKRRAVYRASVAAAPEPEVSSERE
jgi:hypothetical protein